MVDGPNLYAYVNANPWTRFDPEGLAGDTAEYSIWDTLAPATAAVARGGRSPWGGERGAIIHSHQTQPILRAAAVTMGVTYGAPMLAGATIAGGEFAASTEIGATAIATFHQGAAAYATNPVVQGAVNGTAIGAFTYAATGDAQTSVANGLFSGLESYATGPSGKSAQRTTVETAAEVQGAQPVGKARNMSTTAAMSATDADGNATTYVASSRARLTSVQRRAAAEAGAVEVPGRVGEHTEIKLINHALQNDLDILSLDPSRKFCPDCEAVRGFLGVPTSTAARTDFHVKPLLSVEDK